MSADDIRHLTDDRQLSRRHRVADRGSAGGRVRDLLRTDGLSDKVGSLDCPVSPHDLLNAKRS